MYFKFPILCGWRMSRFLVLLLHEENMALIRPSQPLETDFFVRYLQNSCQISSSGTYDNQCWFGVAYRHSS
jgi:hypothetical protein